jgi:hypothetical protein
MLIARHFLSLAGARKGKERIGNDTKGKVFQSENASRKYACGPLAIAPFMPMCAGAHVLCTLRSADVPTLGMNIRSALLRAVTRTLAPGIVSAVRQFSGLASPRIRHYNNALAFFSTMRSAPLR